MSDFRFQPWPGTIAITTLLEFCSWLLTTKKEVDSISTQRKPAPEQAKKELAEQLWLSYYNQVLFEAGLITETERNRMKNKISALAPSASNGVDRSIRG